MYLSTKDFAMIEKAIAEIVFDQEIPHEKKASVFDAVHILDSVYQKHLKDNEKARDYARRKRK